MEAVSEDAVITETVQEVGSLDVTKSGEADLLSDGQNELQGAVIIYDNESQEGQVVKLITNIKSEDNVSEQNADPDNVITLHASSNDSKDETIEENIVVAPTQENIKAEVSCTPEESDVPKDSSKPSEQPASDPDTDDDETIATFITSTGQQLALYAVEDSDEIFAVALYDESGEPPTNFHFLMKADVERLIGEGAVKTVKKPSAQANKQPKSSEKKDEEIKFERVSQVPVIPQVQPQPQIQPVLQVQQTPQVLQQEPQVEKKIDILEKSLAGIKTEILEVTQSEEEEEEEEEKEKIEVVVERKESPAKIITKNHNVNNKTVSPTKPIVNQTRPIVTQTRQIVTQARPIVTQARTIIGQTRPLVTHTKQIITQAKHIVNQPRHIVAQTRQIVGQPRQIVTQARQILTQPRKYIVQPRQIAPQPRQYVAQTKQLLLPARQYVNQSKHYVHQMKPVIYQSKPQIKPAVTPIKKPVVNQKEKITYVLQNQDESYVLDLDSDAEILEQSTVQYMLCDENPSDSELTFDELQASIQSFKTGKPAPASEPASIPTPQVPVVATPSSKPLELQKTMKEAPIIKFSPTIRSTPKPATILTPKKQLVTPVYRTYKSPKKARTTNNLLQAHRKIKQEVIDPGYGDFDDGHMSDDLSQSRQNSTLDSSSGVKVKRSRKQQLTVVNRGDSEIIIQPASAYSEEEDEPVVQRRRGRRKKKGTPDPDYNPRQQQAKKGRRSARLVEVIDIDVDESERSNVMEITLDGKKGSSDKENDVISLGDSDEEDEVIGPRKKKMRKPMMQCTHCMRNFRKRRALERHLQICPKSPAYIEKLEERKKLGVDKKFKCKSCDEYFDIAVSLARHVRVVHSPRKRGRPPKGWVREDKSETDETEESMDESSPDREVGPKRRGRPPRKRSPSKEKDNKSPGPEGETDKKSETPAPESQRQSTSSEPRRRGRPPGKRSFYVEKSVTPELDAKALSSDEKKIGSSSPEPRKRGRPSKRSISQEDEVEEIEEKPSEEKIPDKTEDKTEEASESSTLPKKRGRPKKKSLSKDEEMDIVEIDEKAESSAETSLVEPKKRGRPPKRTLSKDEEPTDDARSTGSEDKAEDEPLKKQKLSDDESEKKSDEPRKRGRPPKDKSALVKDEKTVESSEAETEVEESRKRGRPSRSSESETTKKIKSDVEEMEEVVLSPSQTGKLKKLNCGECGKWFSSVNALNSHQLHMHRTKKSGIRVNRCPHCNNLVPINSFAKHMAMQHGKSVPSTSSPVKSDGSTATTTTTQAQSPDKTVKVMQRNLRSSN